MSEKSKLVFQDKNWKEYLFQSSNQVKMNMHEDFPRLNNLITNRQETLNIKRNHYQPFSLYFCS